MSIGLELEDFGTRLGSAAPARAGAPAAEPPAEPRDHALSEAYERGYKCGWDDAVAAADAEGQRVSEELARNLRDLSFTYFEAREEVVRAATSVLEHVLEAFFPALLPESVAATIANALGEALADDLETPIRIETAESEAQRIAELLEGALPMPFTLAASATVAEGQAHVVFGRSEKQVDVAGLVDRLRGALAAGPEREVANG